MPIRAQNKDGFYGKFGGAYIPEILYTTFEQLNETFDQIYRAPEFWKEYTNFLETHSNRPTPIYFAKNLTEYLGGAKIYLKREDYNQTGAHKFNNAVGQGLLANKMGKNRIIAETGAGQHGVATATMSAIMDFKCTIYMGAKDIARQRPNVFWMEKLGAEVVAVNNGSQTLKDAINECFRDWVSNPDTHYLLGTACGPHPFPTMVSYFQSIIGKEAKEQMVDLVGKYPDKIYACVGGGSNALGIFSEFIDVPEVELVAVEAGGENIQSGKHATRINNPEGIVGISQGYKTYFLQNSDGQMNDTHSIAAGLDYVGISPILSYLSQQNKIRFSCAKDKRALDALALLIKKEGIIAALESAHALAQAFTEVPNIPKEQIVLINLSGRGDKDVFTIAEAFEDEAWKQFITEKSKEYNA